MIIDFVRHWWNAQNEHGLHSPFVFNFYTQVVKSGSQAPQPSIEMLRQQLLSSKKEINLQDFGAGPRKPSSSSTIGHIARNSAKPVRIAKLLARVVQFCRPTTLLDLGTSLGLTTAYLAKAAPHAQIYSFEADSTLVGLSQENFSKLNLQNIEVIPGELEKTLQSVVNKLEAIDFAFFDANHRYIPTLQYLKTCLPKAHEQSIFILDDIYWSKEMKKAWQEVCQWPEITLSLDLFWVGILFFRKKQPKQHFLLKF